MLLQFTVENHLSFDEETTFSLLATRDKDHSGHVIAGKPAVLRGAAIYGANASGKSNLIAAMEFSRRLIVGGIRPGQNIGVRPFALGNNTDRPTRFEWVFRHEGKIWSYLLEVEAARVKHESLYARDENGGRDLLYFDRETDDEGKVNVEFGASLRGTNSSEEAKFLNYVAKGCRPEQPFLAEAWERNVRGIYPALSWFMDGLRIITSQKTWGEMGWTFGSSKIGLSRKAFAPVLINDEKFLRFLSDFLAYADTGIQQVVFVKEPFTKEAIPPLEGEAKEILEHMFSPKEWPDSYFALFPEEAKMPFMVQKDSEGVWILTPKSRRTKVGGQTRDFPFEWESAGTRRLLHLIPWLFRLYTEPTVLIIDELDQHLHTLLTREFVRLAFDSSKNSQGQFIFTTHDTNLLDKDIFRRDEIYFVTKNDAGSSQLRSLAEYKVRGDLVYEKGYLLGRFDAIPTFSGVERLLDAVSEPEEAHAEKVEVVA